MSFIRAGLICCILWASWMSPAFANTHDAFTRLLNRYVSTDASGATFVDYDGFAANAEDMQALDV